MKLGVMDNIVAAGDETATFLRAKRLGLAGVEVNLTREQLRDTTEARLGRLKAAKQASGLEIPSLVLGEHNRGGIGSTDITVSQAAQEDIVQAIAWARELGAGVLLVPFFSAGDLIGEASFARAARIFRELCPLALKHGVALCYEGTLPARQIKRMAEMVDSPAFGCYFDLANVVWRGMDTAVEIAALGGLIRQVHMKETRVNPGDCQPGLGRVDYGAAAAVLRSIGFNGWMVLETPAAPPEVVARDISYTRGWFPEIDWEEEEWPRLGAFSNEFRRGELEGMIMAFQGMGLGAVQLAGELLDEALESPEAARAMGQALADGDIKVAGVAGYRNLVAPDPHRRAENIAYLKRCLEIAPHLGTSVVATDTGTRNPASDLLASPENWSDEAWGLLYDALDQLLPVAERHGSILAIEGYVNHVVQTQGQLIGLLERYPTPHLQLVADPYNFLSKNLLPAAGRHASEYLLRFEHRFVQAQLKDVGDDGAEVETPEFGRGVFPQRIYLAFMHARRPDLPLIFDYLPFQRIPDAIWRVRALV